MAIMTIITTMTILTITKDNDDNVLVDRFTCRLGWISCPLQPGWAAGTWTGTESSPKGVEKEWRERKGGKEDIVEVKTKRQIIFPLSEITYQNNGNKSAFERENHEIWLLVVIATLVSEGKNWRETLRSPGRRKLL